MNIQELQKAVGSDGAPVGLSLNTSFSPQLPNTQPWCVAAPDALASLGVTAGAYVLVAVTNQTAAGAIGGSSPQLSKMSSPMSVSTFAPVSMPSLQSSAAQVLPLWQQLTSATVTASPGQQPDSAGMPGQLVVPAQIWPSSKLPRGLVCVSQSLRQQLAGPSENTVLCILPWKPTQAICAQLTIRLCQDVVKCQVATLDTASPVQHKGAAGTPVGTPPPSKGRPGSSSSKTQATTPKSAMRQTGGDKTPSKTPNTREASTTAPPAAPALGDWVLTLLQPPNGKAGKPMQATQLSAEQRSLLNSLIMQRLGTRMLLQGNPMSVPLFGHSLLCEVVCMRDAAGELITCGMVSPQKTSIEFLLSGETVPEEQILDKKPTNQVANLEQGAAVGLPTGRRLVLQELISTARQAAEDSAKDNSTAEAAATAAQRAVTAGWSAAGLNYSSLGGISHLVTSLRQLVTLPLKAPHLLKSLRVRPPRGVLLHGPPGSGKTVLARAAAGDAGAVLLVVNGPDVMSEFMGESEAGLQGVFAAARALAPAIVFIDEIDAIAPARGGGPGDSGIAASLSGGGGGGSDTASRLVTTLLTCLDGVGAGNQGDGVVVIGATNRPDALDSALRRPGRLDRELEVGPPPPEARLEILHTRLKNVRHSLTQSELQDIAQSAHGFVAADLAALVNEAALSALRRAVQNHDRQNLGSADTLNQNEPDSNNLSKGVAVEHSDFTAARARVRPSSLRELAVEIPRVSWDDVGGLHDVKQRLQEAVVLPFKQPEALARLGAVPPRGVLLYGPPGCSKTLLAKVVAAEARLNFLYIKGGELFSKFVGESEKAISALFTRARATAPSIIFFDEIDSLATARSTDGSGASVADRVMAQLLTEMDGLQQRVGVVVLAATNRPDCIDAALLRPGRFDRLIYVPPPDEQARMEILKVHLKRTHVAQDVDLTTLSGLTHGFSGADLGALVREAALAALQENLDASEVCSRHFNAALELVIPSAMPTPDMEAMYQQFSSAGQLPSKPAIPKFGR